jgi:hypothetical protein
MDFKDFLKGGKHLHGFEDNGFWHSEDLLRPGRRFLRDEELFFRR